MANPKATKCRHCGLPGELYKGAHMKCHGEYCRKMAAMKRGPNKCRRCWIVIETGIKLCSDCAIVARKEALARYEAKRKQIKICSCGCGGELPRGFTGRFLPDHNPRLKRPQSRARRKKDICPKQAAKSHPMGQIAISQPKRVPQLPPTNPHNIEPRRIPPVGAAGWSVSEARRWG